MTKSQIEVLEFENSIKDKNIFGAQYKKKLKEYKSGLHEIVKMFEYTEETSFHEIMLYANAKAMLDLPEHLINMLLTRILLFSSTEEMAKLLNVCRPTLTKYITNIKLIIKKNANTIIESYSN